ncbi:MAG: hypothetical protein AAFU49_00065 [Pseudomonadota bacterium]
MDTLTLARNLILQYGNWSGPGWSNGTGYPGRRLTDAEKFGVGVDSYDSYVAKAHDLNEILGEENLRSNLANLGFSDLVTPTPTGDYEFGLVRDGRFVDAQHYLDTASPQNRAAVADALIMYEQQVMRSNLQFAVDYLSNGVDVWDQGLSAVRMGLQLGAASHIFLGEAAASETRINDLRQFASADIDQQVLDYLSQNFVSPGSGNDASRFMEWPGGDEYNRSVDFSFMIGADREQILATAVALRDAWRSGNPDIAAALAEMEQIGFSDFEGAFSLMQQLSDESLRAPQECFLAGTEISMWDGTKRPIEDIRVGDEVVSYERNGNLVPGRVTQTMENSVRYILDVFGLMVTPGHVTLCGDGRFAGRHVPIINILRSDGALVKEDGRLIRAATNELVGSLGDRMVKTFTGTQHPDGSVEVIEEGEIRLGTRVMKPDGKHYSLLAIVEQNGWELTDDGYLFSPKTGEMSSFYWSLSKRLPKPEDYVLQRSKLTLSDIYAAGEWEAVQPVVPAPIGRFGCASHPQSEASYGPPHGTATMRKSSDVAPPLAREVTRSSKSGQSRQIGITRRGSRH